MSDTSVVHPSAVEGSGGRQRPTDLGDLVRFAVVAGVLAMLADALIGHALLWHNDPYWTYWVTDTLLITTVFGIGTALLGRGVARGAVITVVQMLVLTTYYWSLSPIGLPAGPEWLDLQRTWVTGPPIHFGVYYLGYLVALWLWRHRASTVETARHDATDEVASPVANRGDVELQRRVTADALAALVTALGIVVVAGIVQSLLLGEFPGVTWFVMRTVVLVPFILGWWALAGRERAASLVGGAIAACVLLAYGHYLGPIGMPDSDLRVLAQDPPPSDFHWLTYTEEFLIMGPIIVALAVLGFLLAARWHGERWTPLGLTPGTVGASVVALVVIAAAGAFTAQQVQSTDRTVTVTSEGGAFAQAGPDVDGDMSPAEGELRFVATQANTKRTPLPPRDEIELSATFTDPDGVRYEVVATDPIVNDPHGRFVTWGGVGFDQWNHGRSGIGTDQLDATRSEVATFALGELRADGELVATGVPIHAMTVAGAGVELLVGDPATPVPALPEGHLRIAWEGRAGDSPEGPERARHLLGGVVLVTLIVAALAAARREDTPAAIAR